MKFKKFNSISNITRKKEVDCIIERRGFGIEWVQTLKIDGANYSLYYDGVDYKRAKRSSFLGEDIAFMGDFNFDYEINIKDMYDYLVDIMGCSEIFVIGEIYGGFYDHPDVDNLPNTTRIQKRVSYTPENDFIVYDILIDGMIVGYDFQVDLCERFGFDVVPLLARGNFSDLLKNKVIFPDTLYERFGLPFIEDNLAEGWVLKPVDPVFYGNGSRVILKGKNPDFDERNKKRSKKVNPVYDMSELGIELSKELETYISENRLRNVISHGEIDTITDKSFGKLLGLFAKDILNDFVVDYEDFELLDKKEKHLIKREMNKKAGNLIRPNFLNIIDGVF